MAVLCEDKHAIEYERHSVICPNVLCKTLSTKFCETFKLFFMQQTLVHISSHLYTKIEFVLHYNNAVRDMYCSLSNFTTTIATNEYSGAYNLS